MDPMNTTQTPEQQPAATPTPEASGDQGEKLFTQDDVNRIVSDRLARERAKAEPSPEETREADLRAREARMDCREYINETGFPAALLDLFDTSDSAKFKDIVERLDAIVNLPSPKRPVPRFATGSGGMGGHGAPSRPDLFEEAFRPPKI